MLENMEYYQTVKCPAKWRGHCRVAGMTYWLQVWGY